ncbi:Uncharacterized protein Y057_14271 [Fusarium fujikuroi]|nr:Uncharacterized protein Y057_14271 [Fusarium fujikuroi]
MRASKLVSRSACNCNCHYIAKERNLKLSALLRRVYLYSGPLYGGSSQKYLPKITYAKLLIPVSDKVPEARYPIRTKELYHASTSHKEKSGSRDLCTYCTMDLITSLQRYLTSELMPATVYH